MMIFLTAWFQVTIALWVLNSLIDKRVKETAEKTKNINL